MNKNTALYVRETNAGAVFAGVKNIPVKTPPNYAFEISNGEPVWLSEDGLYVRAFSELESAFLNATTGANKLAAFIKYANTPVFGIYTQIQYIGTQNSGTVVPVTNQANYNPYQASEFNSNENVSTAQIDPICRIQATFLPSEKTGTQTLMSLNGGRAKLLPKFSYEDANYTKVIPNSVYFTDDYITDGNNHFSYLVIDTSTNYQTIAKAPIYNNYPFQFLSKNLLENASDYKGPARYQANKVIDKSYQFLLTINNSYFSNPRFAPLA